MKNKIYGAVRFAIFGITVLSCCFGISHSSIKAEEAEENSYIITAKNDNALGQLMEEYGTIQGQDGGNVIEEQKILVISASKKEAMRLKQDSRVEAVEEDGYVYACGVQEEDAVEWNLDAINIAGRNPVQNGKVAIIDSGIDYSQDIDVAERVNFVPGQDKVSVLYEDNTGHGTCIAGILAAEDNDLGITGVNPNVELYSAKVLDGSNSAKISQIIDAVNWAIEKDVNILSLSFGTSTDSEALHNAIKSAYEHNILIIAAAGNGGEVEYPAAYPEAVAVGSIGTDGTVSGDSSKGEELELVAPGEQILSTGAFDGVMTCGGTSMAVPHVVGVASLLWEKDMDMDAEFIRMVLKAGAKTYDEREAYGYGLVDYGYAESIYEDCKAAYESGSYDGSNVDKIRQDGTVEENTETLDTEAYKDVDYVEGQWKKDQHQELAGKWTGTGLTAADMKVLKIGAIANDNYIQGMTANPQWHGYFKTEGGDRINYVACYIYLTRIAQAVSKGNYSVGKLSYMSDVEYNAMSGVITSSKVNGTSWSTVLEGNAVNAKNKMLIVYGMALHIATDTFSHSTYTLDGKQITHDYEPSEEGEEAVKYAHDQDYCSNRYECAEKIACNVVDKVPNCYSGTVADFYLKGTYDNGTSNKCFKLKRIASYIKSCDSEFYNNHSSFFDNMAVSSLD